MRNADMPAMPYDNAGGLTKREMFAMAAMQGLCANSDPTLMNQSVEALADWSVQQADALLEALESKGAN